jgi:thiamine pyrophosphate-dependent acetolactate synthase large subunit-like protein
MASTAADILVDTIHEWGVNVVFGLPGDGINGIMEALRKRQNKIRFIQVRHEEAAAFMDQATKFAQSLARGEPNRSKIAWTVLSDKVRELV